MLHSYTDHSSKVPHHEAMEQMSTQDATLKDDKRARVAFSPKQLCMLEECFATNRFPKATERKEIASKLNVNPHSIQIWFQNKRAKGRRKEQKMKEVQKRRFVPKPPPFWPENLPFDSNITDAMKSDETDSGSSAVDNKQPMTASHNHGNNQPSSNQQLQLGTDCSTAALHHLGHESNDSYTFQAQQPQCSSHKFCAQMEGRSYCTDPKPEASMMHELEVVLGHANAQSRHSIPGAGHTNDRSGHSMPGIGYANAHSNTGSGSGFANAGPGVEPGLADAEPGQASTDTGLVQVNMRSDAASQYNISGLGHELGHTNDGAGHAYVGLEHFNVVLGHTYDDLGHIGAASVHGHTECDMATPYVMGDALQHQVSPLALPTSLPNGHLPAQQLLMSPHSPSTAKPALVTPQGNGVPKPDGLSHHMHHGYGPYYNQFP